MRSVLIGLSRTRIHGVEFVDWLVPCWVLSSDRSEQTTGHSLYVLVAVVHVGAGWLGGVPLPAAWVVPISGSFQGCKHEIGELKQSAISSRLHGADGSLKLNSVRNIIRFPCLHLPVPITYYYYLFYYLLLLLAPITYWYHQLVLPTHNIYSNSKYCITL